MNPDQKKQIEALDQVWASQGRTEEQKWAVRNFLTGAGAKAIAELIREAEQETAKAYGNCTKCYGKGYATWRHGESYRSHGVYATHNMRNDIKFCSCERGIALEQIFNQGHQEND